MRVRNYMTMNNDFLAIFFLFFFFAVFIVCYIKITLGNQGNAFLLTRFLFLTDYEVKNHLWTTKVTTELYLKKVFCSNLLKETTNKSN